MWHIQLLISTPSTTMPKRTSSFSNRLEHLPSLNLHIILVQVADFQLLLRPTTVHSATFHPSSPSRRARYTAHLSTSKCTSRRWSPLPWWTNLMKRFGDHDGSWRCIAVYSTTSNWNDLKSRSRRRFGNKWVIRCMKGWSERCFSG